MTKSIFSSRPLFRSNAADQHHGAIIAQALTAAGQTPTPTKVLRHALATAAGAIMAAPSASGPAEKPLSADLLAAMLVTSRGGM